MAKLTDIIIVVDETDTVLQYLPYDQATNDIRWRDTAIFLFNDKGDVLLAKRHAKKRVLPNCWGPTASGTVESHESYEQNAYKELFEEVGIKEVTLKHVGNFCMDYGEHKRYTGLFVGIYNEDTIKLALEANQVAAIRWLSVKSLQDDIAAKNELFVPRLLDLVTLIKN